MILRRCRNAENELAPPGFQAGALLAWLAQGMTSPKVLAGLPNCGLLRAALCSAACVLAACSSASIDDAPLASVVTDILGEPPSEFEAELLAGTGVTRSDYESAIGSTVACLESNGFVVEGPFPSVSGRFLEYSANADFASIEDEPQAGTLDQEVDECVRRYEDHIALAWVASSELDEEQAENEAQKMARCLSESEGIAVDHDIEIGSLIEIPQTEEGRTCVEIFLELMRSLR